jgi:phage terminase large subunit
VEDPEYYRHHILGHWLDIGEGQIYKNWSFTYQPEDEAEVLYGLDFGFSSDPTALVEVRKKGKSLWVKELICERGLTNEDLFDVMKQVGVPMEATIYSDSAEPKSIETLRRLGFRNIRPAKKGPDSINAGIDRIRSHSVYCCPESQNLIEEYHQYSYRKGTDKPIDNYNHLMDAFRYALSHDQPQTETKYAVVGRSKFSGNFLKSYT